MKDTLGRENRKIADRRCNECGKIYRPKRELSNYCSNECKWENNGKNNGQDIDHETWWKDSKGYIQGRVWRNGKCFRVRQHRWVMEQYLGRPLSKWETPHHKNEDKTDNRIENLELKEYGEHTTLHHTGRRRKNAKYTITKQESERRRSRLLQLWADGRMRH